MATTTTAGVYMLAAEHAEAIERFASDSALGHMLGIALPPSSTVGTDTVARIAAERLAGDAYWNVIVDKKDVKGFSALVSPYTPAPTLQVWIDPACRRQGYGTLAVSLGLDFAFRNLRVPRVYAAADRADVAQTATLAKFGFAVAPAETAYSLTRDGWTSHRDRPALARLHPSSAPFSTRSSPPEMRSRKRVVAGPMTTASSCACAIRSARSRRHCRRMSFTRSLTVHTGGRRTTPRDRRDTSSPVDWCADTSLGIVVVPVAATSPLASLGVDALGSP